MTAVAPGPNVDEPKDAQTPVVKPAKEELRVEYKWEEVTGADTFLSTAYLLDLSTPWTAEAFKHVLAHHDSAPATRTAKAFSTQERVEIILQISKKFEAVCQPAKLKQPCVSFVGQEVHVASLDEALLEAFWRSPPVFKGHAMKFVSRGMPFDNISTSYGVDLPAMSRDKLIRDELSWKMNGGYGNIKMVMVSLYHVKGFPGDPMLAGDVYVHIQNRGYHGTPQLLGKTLVGVAYP